MDVDELTSALSNAEVDQHGPSGQVNRLAEQLATSSLVNQNGTDALQSYNDSGSADDQHLLSSTAHSNDNFLANTSSEIVFPPNATVEEQLLVLAGADDML